jgi:pimeloyl-ACP methyl ester carboxylesterase
MGPTYLLLPGLHGTAALFEPLLKAMPTEVARRVIAYPTNKVRGYGALLRMIEERTRDLQEMVVIGESFSGALALRFAAAHSGRVKAVILCAGFIGPSVPRVLCYLGAPLALLQIPLPGVGIRSFVSGFKAPREVVRALRREFFSVQGHVVAHRILAVSALNAAEALRRCRVPILYLAGRRDRLVGTRGARRIKQIRPDVKVRMLDAPHLLLQVKPAEAWREISAFVEQTLPRAEKVA